MLALILFTLNSCDKFVDVDLPKSQLTNITVFEDYTTADAALTDIYSKIRDRGMLNGTSTGLSLKLGNYTDEITPYGSSTSSNFIFYNNSLVSTTSDVAEYWNATYNQIYAANSVIEGAEKSTNLTVQNKKQLTGEAIFIRALLHLYLVNLFGDIPYIKHTDYNENRLVTKMPTKEVYQNIVTDLSTAISLLPTEYSSVDRVRPSQYVARALLARTYLYSGEYLDAVNTSSILLNQPNIFLLEQNINKVFLINSKETIWQLKSAIGGQNAKEGGTFIFLSGPPSSNALNIGLVNSFNSNDLRRANWIKLVSNSSSSWYHAYKYKERTTTGSSLEYSIVFRLSEQYLIRAEARVFNGDLQGARDDLNQIRQRAGLGNTPAITKAELLASVLEERRWELFTEYGHRFFDLKRFGKIDDVLSVIKPGWNNTDRLFPIPQSELATNPNLRPQNPGY